MLAALHTLEISFIILLLAMLGFSGVIALVIVVRVVEPGGTKALLARLRGMPTALFKKV